jgi:hypothetical protein
MAEKADIVIVALREVKACSVRYRAGSAASLRGRRADCCFRRHTNSSTPKRVRRGRREIAPAAAHDAGRGSGEAHG